MRALEADSLKEGDSLDGGQQWNDPWVIGSPTRASPGQKERSAKGIGEEGFQATEASYQNRAAPRRTGTSDPPAIQGQTGGVGRAVADVAGGPPADS